MNVVELRVDCGIGVGNDFLAALVLENDWLFFLQGRNLPRVQKIIKTPYV